MHCDSFCRCRGYLRQADWSCRAARLYGGCGDTQESKRYNMHVSLDIDSSWSELGGATSVVASAEAVSALQVK